jgi:hypothetical protein
MGSINNFTVEKRRQAAGAAGNAESVTAPVIIVLSTGRCGTQWLAAGLREFCAGVDVEHEPLGPLYRPRRYFRRFEDPTVILEVPEIAEHVHRIEHARRTYVETGWPVFPALPALAAMLGDRLRIVHLTRHPIPSALSHLCHQSYAGSPRDDAYTRLATLAPTDPGVRHPGWAADWDQLSPYERCLYWWTEVHEYALELPQRIGFVPWLQIKSEDVLQGGQELRRLLEFMGVEWDERWRGHAGQVVDRWHHHTEATVDPLQVRAHPDTVAVARRLGYWLAGLDIEALNRRYRGRAEPGLDRVGRY